MIIFHLVSKFLVNNNKILLKVLKITEAINNKQQNPKNNQIIRYANKKETIVN